jgi:hypothetical protein
LFRPALFIGDLGEESGRNGILNVRRQLLNSRYGLL